MRDPDLVQRAEQAATALEQAWIRWRTRHGLGSGPLPPVSSYVGYSVEEPWGQPRVVLGVEASEAERLAEMLDGHDGAGADRPGLPEHRQPAELDPAPVRTIPDAQLPAELDPAPVRTISDTQLPVGVQPPRQAAPQPGSLVAGSGRAGSATAEPQGRSGARLKDLAARVTALHAGPGAYDEAEPEATQAGLADGSGPASSRPLAGDSAGRAQVLPVSRLGRPRKPGGDPAAPAWPAGESQQPTADTAV
jgi:hypothetical protein